MRRIISIGLPVMFLIGLGVVWVGVLKVERIECRSQYGACSDRVQSALSDVELGVSIRQAKVNAGEILGIHERVRRYTSRFEMPDKLRMDVIERRAEVGVQAGEQYKLMNREGEELGKVSKTLLPRVYIGETTITKEQEQFAVNLLFELFRLKRIGYGLVEENGMRVSLEDGTKVIFPLEGEVDVLVGRMAMVQMWLKARPQEIRITLVDLRYDNAVLR